MGIQAGTVKATSEGVILLPPEKVAYNPVQNRLFPERTKDRERLNELAAQFISYGRQHGESFDPDYPIKVRPAAEAERRLLGVDYVAIDGNRRLTVARQLELKQVPALVDRRSSPEDDLLNLKRVVEGDEGYSQIDRARLVEEMIRSGIDYEELKKEYKPEIIRRILGYIHAPADLRAAVEIEPQLFTRLGRVVSAIYSKADGDLKLSPPKGVSPKDAESLVRFAWGRADLSSEDAKALAVRARQQLQEGKIRITSEGDIEYAHPYKELGVDVAQLVTPEAVWAEFSHAVERLGKGSGSFITRRSFFNEALAELTQHYELTQTDLAQVLDTSVTYVMQLLSRSAHPSAENLGRLRVGLTSSPYKVPQIVADQLLLLGVRDSECLKTRQTVLAEEAGFKAGGMLRAMLADYRITQSDLTNAERGCGVSQSRLSQMVSDRARPGRNQRQRLATFLRKRSVPETRVAQWIRAAQRDALLFHMKSSDEFDEPFVRKAIKALDVTLFG